MYFKVTGLFILIFTLMVGACITTHKSTESNTIVETEQCFKKEAFKSFGNDTVFLYNTDSSFVLCLRKIPVTIPNPNELTEFFVYDCVTCNLVCSDKISGAVIGWYDRENLLIVRQKGFIENNSDSGNYSYVFNIISHSKREINNDLHIK